MPDKNNFANQLISLMLWQDAICYRYAGVNHFLQLDGQLTEKVLTKDYSVNGDEQILEGSKKIMRRFEPFARFP